MHDDLPRERAWLSQPSESIEAVGDEAGSVLVVPVGSVEQHGHHLPVGTDTLLVEAVVAETARRLDDSVPLLVTPTLWSGFSPHHASLGGTLTLDHDTMADLLHEVATSGLRSGFDGLVFVNGHGGNKPLLSTATSTVGGDEPDVEVLGLTYFDLAAPFVDEIRESETGGMSHGGEFETSLMLHCYPDLVGDDRPAALHDEPAERGLQDMFEGGPVGVYREFEAYSETGAIGAPHLATAEKGERLLDGVADEFADLLVSMHERLL